MATPIGHAPDGVFEYFGEGQVGNMIMARGNAAIANHAARGKSLLLFRSTNGGLRFDGEWVYSARHHEEAPDTLGNRRQAIVFELVPIENLLIDDIDLVRKANRWQSFGKLAFLVSKEVVETTQGARTIY